MKSFLRAMLLRFGLMAAMLGLFFIFIPIFEKKRSPTPKEVGIGVVCIVVGSGLLVVHRTTRFS